MGIPAGSVLKNLPANAGDARDTGLIPGSGRCPIVGNGNLDLQRADFVKGFLQNPFSLPFRDVSSDGLHCGIESSSKLSN